MSLAERIGVTPKKEKEEEPEEKVVGSEEGYEPDWSGVTVGKKKEEEEEGDADTRPEWLKREEEQSAKTGRGGKVLS
jgi:hypothetical protein